MKKYLLNIALAVVVAAILIAVGFNAVSGQVTVEEKQSSFKLTDFDFIVRSPAKEQIADFDKNDAAVKAIFPCYEMEVNCSSESTSPKLRILFSDDMDDYGISLFNEKTLVSGSFDKSGIMLDEKAADKLRVNVGDSVSLALKGRSFTYRVAAIYRASTYNTLKDGIGLVEFTSEIENLYKDAPKKLSYTLAFIDAEDSGALAAALTSYKPLGNLKLYEDFIKDYNRNPALSDDEWNDFLEAKYKTYYDEASAALKADGNVERKSDYMADVADRIETTQHKVDALTVGIAVACAVIFTLVSVVILYLGKNNDLILAREGAEKAHIAREKLAVNFASSVLVALVSFGVLFGFASMKGFVNETLGAVMLCSLPVLVNIPASFVAVKLYLDGIYGKAEMAAEDDGILRLEEGEDAPADKVPSDDTPAELAEIPMNTEDDSDSADIPAEDNPEGDTPMDDEKVPDNSGNDPSEITEDIPSADEPADTDTAGGDIPDSADIPADDTLNITVTEGALGEGGETPTE